MSKIQTDETELSDFARAFNSTMDKLENVVETLSVMSEKIKKSGLLEESSRRDTARNEKGPSTEEIKKLTNDAATSTEISHKEPSETHSKTEITTNTGTGLQQSKPMEIQESAPATVRESGISRRNIFTGVFNKISNKASSKSNYFLLVIALTVFCIIVVKIYFMLFP